MYTYIFFFPHEIFFAFKKRVNNHAETGLFFFAFY